jgi:uroporphyrinogen-III synthase
MAELVPDVATSEALGEAMTKEQTLDNLNILLITGNRNGDTLRNKLEAAAAIVDSVQVYATEFADISTSEQAARFRKDGADAIIFASGSAVDSFVSQAASLKTSPNALRPATCSIGPVTSAAMQAKGLPVDMEAPEASPDGVVKTLTRHFASR